MDYLRTFVAIDVKVEPILKKKWDELKLLLRNVSIKWVDDHAIHLTLFFLGDTPSNQIERIGNKLEEDLRNTPSFKLYLNGLGTFGSRHLPKIIWVGVSESQQLLKLKTEINSILSEFGFDELHGKFSPHLTLCRVRHIESRKELENFIFKNNAEYFHEIMVDRVIFYQSTLSSFGPIYKPLKEIKLLSL